VSDIKEGEVEVAALMEEADRAGLECLMLSA
jgi:hypothetical protein